MSTLPSTSPVASLIDPAGLSLNDPADVHVEVRDIAGTKAFVVDNLYRSPDYVRQLALSLDFRHANGSYPGRFANISLPVEPLLALVNGLLREHRLPAVELQEYYRDMHFAMVTSRAEQLTAGQSMPHFDGFCDLAGIVYLNLPDRCSGGTSFWRHRGTGLSLAIDRGTPSFSSVMRRLDLSSHEAVVQHCMSEALNDLTPGWPTDSTPYWERTAVLEMKWNRLVFYNAWLFHTIHYEEAAFGETPAERRLTQNVYFSVRGTSNPYISF